ncbi:hypothetical protein [Methylobacterium aerolatum]|uniref:Transglycosylase SLT domain-containing protein n=1 Tax=Methylobacterium aerolatum TaxID=418708 RepID=A0ABU0I6V9_9HYPH|nr:hypothetical protein [Methylobacterium aerolatum]MDQ0449832.1 hypothetical protein [Methylobacterium aerolatum]GJD36601.1 hypothetical protein FMGBMHLM_3524 [Methylobacterium aerolatum]
MSQEVLKEFLLSVGFKVDESSYKKTSTLITSVEKQLIANDKAAKERDAADKARVAGQTLRAAEVAANLRMVGVAVAGFATLAVGALAAVTTAVKNGIGEFDRLAYISGRTGASVNNIKAIGYAFSQTGSSAEAAVQALENFAKARRANPGVDGIIRSYGVSTQGDGSEVLSNALDAITKRHPQYTSQRVAAELGMSPDDVDHWIRYRKEIAQFEKQYKDLRRTFGVNGGEMARASTAISRALGEWSGVVEVLRDKLVSLFLPAIESVTTALSGLLKHLTSEENVSAIVAYFDKPLAALKELVRWIGLLYDQFVRLFEYVRNSPIGKIIGAINPGYFREKLLDAIVPGAQAATNDAGDTSGSKSEPGVIQRGWNAVKRGLGFGSKVDKTEYKFDGKNADVLRQAAKELGTSPEDLATVISYESKFRPNVWGGKGGNYMGLIQFGPNERRDHGANDKQTFAEQMPAVVRFLKSRGFKPGMGLNQLYATINGGNPYASQNKNDGNGTIGQHVARMRASEAARVRAFLGAGGTAGNAPAAATPNMQPSSGVMSPGTFRVDDALRSQPMGSVSNSNDNSRSATMNSNVNVTVNGAADPQATGAAVARSVGTVNDMSLRNVQTAIR